MDDNVTSLDWWRRHHARASTGSSTEGSGRGTPSGHGIPGQLSENHCIVRSIRRTWMSAPLSMASNFLVSPSERQLTVDKLTDSAWAYARATQSNCSIPVMPEISVILPRKSTAILPDARIFESGHTTGMNLQAILDLIDQRLEALGLSATKASRLAVRHSDAIRNIRRALKKGRHGVNARTLAALENVLQLAPGALQAAGSARSLGEAVEEKKQQIRDEIATLEQRLSGLKYALVILEEPSAPTKPPRKRVR